MYHIILQVYYIVHDISPIACRVNVLTCLTLRNNSKEKNFNQYKDSLMFALKKCRNMLEIVHRLCSHFGESKAGLINLTLYDVLYTVLPLTDLISNANNTSREHTIYV
jgi:hypothetical protein